MSLTTTNNRNQYNASGQTSFTYTFLIFAASDLVVYVDSALKVLTTDYTVTGVGLVTGGTVVFGVAPANGAVVTLIRNVALTRSADYQQSGDFRAVTVNSDFDRLIAMVQQVQDELNRAIIQAPGDVPATLTLPMTAARANTFLAFDASGNAASTNTIGRWRGTWATATGYNLGDLVADGAAGANTQNIYYCNATNTSTSWATNLANGLWGLAINVTTIGTAATAAAIVAIGPVTAGSLGLGTASLANTGTSGHTLGYLDAANTRSGALTMAAAFNESGVVSIAAAATTDLATVNSNNVYLSGGSPVTITSFGTLPQGARRWVRNASGSVFTIQQNANLHNLGSVDIAVAPNDQVMLRSDGAGQWFMDGFVRGSGGVAVPATAAQTLNGTDNTLALTAAGFSGNKSIGTNGYYKLPAGLNIQWGNVTVGGSTTATVTFPIAFSSQALSITTTYNNNAVPGVPCCAQAISVSQMTVANGSSISQNIFWMAIGF